MMLVLEMFIEMTLFLEKFIEILLEMVLRTNRNGYSFRNVHTNYYSFRNLHRNGNIVVYYTIHICYFS